MTGINSLEGVKCGDVYERMTHSGERQIWVVESFCELPTIKLRLISPQSVDGEIAGAVGSLIVQDLVKLVPESNQ